MELLFQHCVHIFIGHNIKLVFNIIVEDFVAYFAIFQSLVLGL